MRFLVSALVVLSALAGCGDNKAVETDRDHDGVEDSADNCPDVANPDQANADGDMLGDACDACPATPTNDPGCGSRQNQTITFTSTAPASAVVGGTTYDVVATASSGLTVALTIDATASSVCSLSGSTVSFIGAGNCVINADQAGDASFNAAPRVQQTFAVGKAPQTISFTSTAPATAVVAGATYTATATATSGLPVALTIDATASAVCSITGSTVAFVGAGNCVINADQAGNASYSAATRVQQSFAVGKGTQTVTFTSTAPATAAVAGATYVVSATASSGLAVTVTVDASATSVCALTGSTVSFIGVGTCVLDANQTGNANYTAAAQVQQSFAVGKGAQTITFTSTKPANALVGDTYNVAATASSGLPVSLTIDATAAGVCSIAGSTVSMTGPGTCVIDANQAGNASFNAAPQLQQSFGVTKVAQTISFTTTPPASAVFGATYNVAATASSGLPVSLTIDASAASVCSITGSTVSFVGTGTCVIDANQAGNTTYGAAPQVQQSFAIGKAAQTISFTSTPPASAQVGGTYTVSATASSGLPVTLSIDASATSVCSLAGSTVSFTAPGTCVIDANQAGNANYTAAAQVQQSFAVTKVTQTITFTSTPPATPLVGGTYNVTATASSGLAVSLAIDATATATCSLAGSTVTFLGPGTCIINANQAGNATYSAAAQVQQSFDVNKTAQTITFTSTAPTNAVYGGATYSVSATASSGLTVSLTIDASASSICSIAGSTVSFIGVGTCVINANQAGNTTYGAAQQVQQSFSVGKAPQTISFTTTAPASATANGPSYSVAATATSGLPVSITIDATSISTCMLVGSNVFFIAGGTCMIDANQAGDATHAAAPQVQQSIVVNKASQTITFTSTPPASALVGGTYSVSATASSGLTVTLSIDASASSVCSISGSTVTFTAAGTCVIDANQAGNVSYSAAPQVQQSFSITKASQTISFTSTAPSNALVGGTYNVSATATSGLAVTFTIDAVASSVCSIAGSTVTFNAPGTCVVDANQSGNANYSAAPQVQQSFTVSKASQTISFTTTPPASAQVSGATYTVAATATSGLTVTLSIDATATSVCSLSGSTVSFIGAGTCVIDANQAGNANYAAAPQVQQSFTVTRQAQTISFTSTAPANATAFGATYTVTAAATSGLAVSFTIDASASSVCSISGSTVSFLTSGTCVIDANQAGNTTYNAAPQVQQSFTVAKATQTITFTSTAPTSAVYQGTAYTVSATATSGLTVSFSIEPSSLSVCTVSGSTVSFVGTGTCVVNANQAGNAAYLAAPQVQQTFTVGPRLVADSYSVVGNTQLVAAGHSAPTTPYTTNATTILANDAADVAITPTTVTGAATTGGGAITIDTSGRFTYTPPVGASSGTDTYTYTATANGVSRTATITFSIANVVWYVDNASTSAHDGRSSSPFVSLASLTGKAGIGAYIYVAKGTGTTPGAYTLLGSQQLIGAGATLSVGALTIAANAANTPTLGGTLSANSVSGLVVNGVIMSTGALPAINFTNTDGTFTFTSITTNGASNGIVWNNTTQALPTSSFTINGDGSNTAVGGNASGGVLANMSGADGTTAGTAIYLKNVGNVTLRRMLINGSNQNYGIHGFGVNGFTLEYSTLSGTSGTAASLGSPETAGEGTIYFGNTSTNGIATSGTFTSNVISGGRARNVSIINTAAGTTTLTFKGNSFGLNQNFVDASQNVAVEARGSGTIINAVVGGTAAEKNTFTGAPGDLINITGQTGSTIDAQIKSNAFSNSHAQNIIGGGGLTLATQGTMTFVVDSNTVQGADGSALTLQKASAGALLSGRVTNNTIGVSGVAGSGSKSGNGIFLSAAGTGTTALTIQNNQIRNWANAGMYFDNTGGSYSANFTITGNVIAEPSVGAFASLALTNGSPASTDTVNVCAVIGGASKNSFTGAAGVADVYLGASGAASGHTFNLPGYAGSSLANVQSFVSANNTIGGGASYIVYADAPATAAAFTGVGFTCPTP